RVRRSAAPTTQSLNGSLAAGRPPGRKRLPGDPEVGKDFARTDHVLLLIGSGGPASCELRVQQALLVRHRKTLCLVQSLVPDLVRFTPAAGQPQKTALRQSSPRLRNRKDSREPA